MADENDNQEQEQTKRDELLDLLKQKGYDEATIEQYMSIVDGIVDEETPDNAKVKIEQIKAQKIAMVLEQVMGFITGDNVKSIIEKWGERKKHIIEAEAQKVVLIKDKDLDNMKDARSFLRYKYWQDILLVAIVLVAIGTLSLTQNIDRQVTGTLVAAIIGYALGRFKNRPEDN